MLTEPLTKKKLGEYFTCHRNDVEEKVLNVYPHETIGVGRGERYRMHAADMLMVSHMKHKAP